MMDKHLAAPLALILASAVVVVIPAARGEPLKWIVNSLFCVFAAQFLWRGWRAGLLSKTPGQIFQQAQAGRLRSHALDLAAIVISIIATTLLKA